MGNILVMDDKRSIRITAKAFLEAEGHTVETAVDVDSAMVILGQISMGLDFDGYHHAKSIRRGVASDNSGDIIMGSGHHDAWRAALESFKSPCGSQIRYNQNIFSKFLIARRTVK